MAILAASHLLGRGAHDLAGFYFLFYRGHAVFQVQLARSP